MTTDVSKKEESCTYYFKNSLNDMFFMYFSHETAITEDTCSFPGLRRKMETDLIRRSECEAQFRLRIIHLMISVCGPVSGLDSGADHYWLVSC